MAKKKKSAKAKAGPATEGIQVVMRNRKVRHDYEVLDTFEAGMVLLGSEVKSLREGNAQWADAHARIDDRREVWLYGFYIGEYKNAGVYGHLPTQRRKLLLHRFQVDRLAGSLQAKGLSLVPIQVHFRKGWAKCDLCLVRGRKHEDKRAAMIERERKRDVEREIARRMKH